MTRSLLFDLDGTLIDSRPGIVACLHATLRGLGHTPDPDADYTWAVGPPLEQSIGRVLAPFGDDRVALGARLYREQYALHGVLAAELFSGIAAALDALADRPLFVVTSKRETFARSILDRLHLAPRFVGIHGTVEGGAFDDKAVLLRHALVCHAIEPAQTAMIGDRHHDFDAARANGMPSLGVAWGYAQPGELDRADRLVPRPQDLPAAVATLD